MQKPAWLFPGEKLFMSIQVYQVRPRINKAVTVKDSPEAESEEEG